MSKPEFGLNEIAITAYNRFSENRGKIVLLKEYLGSLNWPQIKEPQHVWIVECISEGTYLNYLYSGQLDFIRTNTGPMPECFLRRITPQRGQAVLELFGCSKVINFDNVTV